MFGFVFPLKKNSGNGNRATDCTAHIRQPAKFFIDGQCERRCLRKILKLLRANQQKWQLSIARITEIIYKSFCRNLGIDYQQTFRRKPSVFISEVCRVIVHYHVTNVEERRRGPGPKCETERTGAPLFCSGLGPPPFPITLLLFPSFANLVHYLGS